jgi:hypothetical protein
MFPASYFAARYFNSRFWPKIGAEFINVGPIITAARFRVDQITGRFGVEETRGIFRDPDDDGVFRP